MPQTQGKSNLSGKTRILKTGFCIHPRRSRGRAQRAGLGVLLADSLADLTWPPALLCWDGRGPLMSPNMLLRDGSGFEPHLGVATALLRDAKPELVSALSRAAGLTHLLSCFRAVT